MNKNNPDQIPLESERALAELAHSGLFKRELLLTRLIYGFAICVTIGLAIFAVRNDRVSRQRMKTAARSKVQRELSDLRSRLESNLSVNVQLTWGLPGLFRLLPNLTQEEFELAVSPLFERPTQIRHIAVAPDMVINLIYPLEGNEKAIGLDYRKSKQQFAAADRARRVGDLVLAGPVDLVQGGKGFVSRFPVFEQTAEGPDRFWGLIATVIDADKFYEQSGLLDKDLGLEVAIRGKDGTGRYGEHFFGSHTVFENDPVSIEIQVPQGTWLIGAVPKGGWTTQSQSLWIQRGFFLMAALLIVTPLILLARTRALLTQVAIRRQWAEQERHKIEQKMLHSQKLESLGVLAGGIAHDFNNILTAIIGFTQLLSYKTTIDDESKEFLESIDSAAEQAAALCQQLLSYSGKGQFDVKPVDMSEMIRETEALLRVSIPKLTQVELGLADNIPLIEADEAQLRQVLMNLISNAIDSIGNQKGRVTIETGLTQLSQDDLIENLAGNKCAPGEFVFARISDTGCGMDSQTLEKVFDPFFTTKSSGRGLGMAAVLGVVRSHQGAIFCESVPGKGTTFRVAFHPTDKTMEAIEVVKSKKPTARQTTILLVDDEAAVRSVIKKTLIGAGHSVKTAKNGREGIEIYKKHCGEISLCIVDMAMPKLGGLETLNGIRDVRSDARVILISGFSEEEINRSSGREQPNAFIKKPFRTSEILAVVNRLLEGPN